MGYPDHQAMIKTVTAFVKADDRFVGAALGGSYITNTMDAFSDLDFVLVCRDEVFPSVMDARMEIAQSFGPLLSAFTREHVGEPRLIICLYGGPILHVDLKFVALQDFGQRIEDPVILYEENGCLGSAMESSAACWPTPDLQWIEDRFWVWVHYAATKLGRGELFEVMDHLAFLRRAVLAPLAAMACGKLPRGVRKIEADAPEWSRKLEAVTALHDAGSCADAVRASIALYLELRERCRKDPFTPREEAQRQAVEYLDQTLSAL